MLTGVPERSGRTAMLGLAGIAAGAATVAAMHVLGPSAQVNITRRTISEYALLDNGWVFNSAVLLLAAGSVAVLLGLIRAGLVAAAGVGSAALLFWVVGLLGVVIFPKHNWAVGPSISGDLHRMASVVAFLSLPVAALAVGFAWLRHPRWRRYGIAAVVLGGLCLACFAPIPVALLLEPVTGMRWWRAIPLGAVERLLATAEVVTLMTLGWWATRVSPCVRPGETG
ncbi:MAG TPA: DUF998 domain-containing protein [Micromonosporaceae bacterium]|nr:DUF998 domain-containing protein [Micromonosporaceae bacterium]